MKGKETALIVAGLGAGVLLLQTNAAQRAIAIRQPSPEATPKPTPSGGGCGYPRANLPTAPAKTNAELVQRVEQIIKRVNPGAISNASAAGYRSNGVPFPTALARALVAASQNHGIPLDLLTAICQRESTFRYYLSDSFLANAIPNGVAMGPLQVKAIAFRQVGMKPELMQGWQPDQNRVIYAVGAGAKYLAWTRRQIPESWCAAVHAYYTGVAGYQSGRRNQPYVDTIMGWANTYTELRT